MKHVTALLIAAAFVLTMTHMAYAEDTKVAVHTASVLASEDKCKRTAFKTPEVKAACAKGLKAAIKLMKGFVKKAKKATGEKINCKSCHSGLKKEGYPLKSDGLAMYKKLKKTIEGAKVTPHLTVEDAHLIERWSR